MRGRLRIVIESIDQRLLDAVYGALYPESQQPPSTECSISQVISGDKLVITIECDRINLLRAVANSYLGVISSLVQSLEEIGVE